MNTNKTKANQLGMPIGTAQNRLRKIILFSVLKKHNENICYRCEKTIETVDELSLDHKLPWLGVNNELFWDISNVAFSHLSCNSAAGRKVNLWDKTTTPCPEVTSEEGYSWCGRCKQHKPINEFWKSNSHIHRRSNGLRNECKECSSARNFRQYHNKKD